MSTIDDLRRTLEAHSRGLPLSDARTVAVHRRIRRIRRRRVGAATTAVLLVAAVGVPAVRTATDSAQPAASTRNLPEYTQGGRLVATLSVDGRATAGATTTVVPTGDTLLLSHEPCSGPGRTQGSVFVRFVVNGSDTAGASCDSGGSVSVATGLTAGRPASVQVSLVAHLGVAQPPTTAEEARILARTQVRAGVYVPVPRSQYVFPPRPKHVGTVSEFGDRGTVVSQQAAATSSTRVGLSNGLQLDIDLVEPGVVTAELDGTVVGTVSSWDYTLRSDSLDVGPDELAAHGVTGASATLTLRESGFADVSGAWQAVIRSPIVGGAPASGGTR